jgi:hypothetical protein
MSDHPHDPSRALGGRPGEHAQTTEHSRYKEPTSGKVIVFGDLAFTNADGKLRDALTVGCMRAGRTPFTIAVSANAVAQLEEAIAWYKERRTARHNARPVRRSPQRPADEAPHQPGTPRGRVAP